MVNVIVTGLPYNLRVHKFIDLLINNVFQENVRINVNYICNDGDTAKISLSMRSSEARKVVRYLDGYDFTSRRMKYPLRCWKEDGPSDVNNSDNSKPPSKTLKSSPSPVKEPDPLHVIDRQIQLIKKQRILIEEESKLLIEKKRLEMIQNLGPDDFHKLCMLNQKSDAQPLKLASSLVQNEQPKMPEFAGPCKLIFGEMTNVIRAHVDKRNRVAFMKLLRANVRKRLSLALKDEDYMPSQDIFSLYRVYYPKEKDESLVRELLGKLTQKPTKIYVGDKGEAHCSSTSDNKDDDIAFYEDVNPDFDNVFKLDANPIPNEIGFEKEGTEEKCEVNQDITNESSDENKDAENKEESNKDVSREEIEDKAINEQEIKVSNESSSVLDETKMEDFDVGNDLDDWMEDEGVKKMTAAKEF